MEGIHWDRFEENACEVGADKDEKAWGALKRMAKQKPSDKKPKDC